MKASDYASVLEALHNESALATHLAQQEILIGPSAEFCQVSDCDMPIPEERRQAIPGVQRCAQCQTRRERSKH
ncbi:TraR/DksA C4-type zinc finger protein [Pseudomonas sp. LG1D9]|uniref:TraR/DksA C4-type zinc finger protein n=1 Tax=Pseudomonas sp. LG1D9 TaxID=2083054 RepID=UPI000CF358BF